MVAALGVVSTAAVAAAMVPQPVQAGPLMRRVEARRACQEFASKLQAASANPAIAQQVYQQGVMQLVAQFGENPCTDIPAPVATPATAAPVPASTGTGTSSKQPSAQQQQACQQFASKLQAAAASGGSAAAQQTYAMGNQKLTGMFGPDPCPAVKPPQ
jgi:hypothetical protein